MIPYGRHHIDDDDIQAVVKVLKNGMLTQGPLIEEFEEKVASYVGAKYAVAVSSGTAALHIAALASGVTKGKMLATSPITFVASANAAVYAGGTPIFADIESETINICPDRLRQVFKENNSVSTVIPVHFAGLACEMEDIKQCADEFGAVVVEDAAHALGASYKDGNKVGSCVNSLMTVFSFHPVKAIAAGEGGMVTTNDEKTYRKLLRLRSHGINKLDDPFQLPEQAFYNNERNPWYYEMQELGFNYRITDIQCALAISQLEKLDSFVDRRRQLACTYDRAFAGLQLVSPAQAIGREQSGHHLYVLRIDFANLGMHRSEFMLALRSKDIMTQVHYIPVTHHPYYQSLGHHTSSYPESQCYYEQALSIPLHYGLSDSEQEHVVNAIRELVS